MGAGVDIARRKIEHQVQFWSLLGPFFALLSVAVLLFKISPHWYFPVSALIGIPLCVKWKVKGMACALGCLFLFAAINYQGLELDDRYWHVGLALAMAFSFVVLTLSQEEVQGLVHRLQLESQSRFDNFLLLNEKWKTAEQDWSLESEKCKEEIALLTKDIARVQEEKQTFYKLSQLAKEELIQVREQHNLLLDDLAYKKQQVSQMYERLEETDRTVQEFVNSDAEKQLRVLSKELAILKEENQSLSHRTVTLQRECEECGVTKDHFQRELEACLAREKICVADKDRTLQDREEERKVMHALQNRCAVLEQEKEELSSQKQAAAQAIVQEPDIIAPQGGSRTVISMYAQLKKQFEEKNSQLDAVRSELFLVKEELLTAQKKHQEELLTLGIAGEKGIERDLARLASQYEQMQNLYQQEIDELTEVITHLLSKTSKDIS